MFQETIPILAEDIFAILGDKQSVEILAARIHRISVIQWHSKSNEEAILREVEASCRHRINRKTTPFLQIDIVWLNCVRESFEDHGQDHP